MVTVPMNPFTPSFRLVGGDADDVVSDVTRSGVDVSDCPSVTSIIAFSVVDFGFCVSDLSTVKVSIFVLVVVTVRAFSDRDGIIRDSSIISSLTTCSTSSVACCDSMDLELVSQNVKPLMVVKLLPIGCCNRLQHPVLWSQSAHAL